MKRLLALAATVLVWVLLPSLAEASHFRGGTIAYRVDAAGVVTIEMQTLWRDSFVDSTWLTLLNSSRTQILADGSDFALIAENLVNPAGRDLIGYYARLTQTYRISLPAHGIASGTYLIRLEDCCRVADIHNVSESTFSLETRVVYLAGQANGSPTMIPATIDIVARGYNYVQSLLSQDPDRGPVNYEFLLGDLDPNWGPGSAVAGISVDSDGIIRIPAANTLTAALGRWVYKVRVSDTSGAYSERDILVLFQDPTAGNTAPVLAPITNPQGPYPIGTAIGISVAGTDTDGASQFVVARSGPLPWGATTPQATVASPGTASTAFAWTPVSGDEGVHRVYFETHDEKPSDGLFTPFIDAEIVQITVADHYPPQISIPPSTCVVVGTPVSFLVTASDPDGAAVNLHADFLPSGASFPPVSGSGNVSGTFSWTPTAGQTGDHNIVFSATDGGSPSLTISNGISIAVAAALPTTNLLPTSVTCNASTQLTCQVGNGVAPYTIEWQARPDSSSPWVTFEVDTASGSAASGKTNVHPASVGFPQTSATQYRALVRDTSNCNVSSALVTVSGTGTPPSISAQPQAVSICAGQTATFSIAANAEAFQWQRSTDFGATWNNVAGATATSHTTPPQFADAYYRCTLLATCSAPIASNTARLTVMPLPGSPGNSLRMSKVSANLVHLEWPPIAEASSYDVLRCNAASGPCSPSTYLTSSTDDAEDGAATGPAYWYQIAARNACGVTP